MSREVPEPWIPEKDAVRLASLAKLSEELAECVAIAVRCINQGIGENNPDTGKPNKQALEEEIADVQAQMLIAITVFDLDQNAIIHRRYRKENFMKQWLKMLRAK